MKNKTKNGAAAAEFIPMKDFSNGCADDVLFVRGSADTSSLWEATMSRLTAIKNLLEFGAVALQKTGNINNETSMLTDSALILISDAVSIMDALYKSINEQPEQEKLGKYVRENTGESVYLVNDAEMEKIIMVKDMANIFCNLTGVTPQDITVNGNSFCSVMGISRTESTGPRATFREFRCPPFPAALPSDRHQGIGDCLRCLSRCFLKSRCKALGHSGPTKTQSYPQNRIIIRFNTVSGHSGDHCCHSPALFSCLPPLL
jgi:hypothetical protein